MTNDAESITQFSTTPNLILTCDVDFVDLASEELFAAAPAAQLVATLADGVLAIFLPDGFLELAERWRTSPPIFVRHICPVDFVVPLRGTNDDRYIVRDATKQFVDALDPELPFSVQTRIFGELPYKPFDLNQTVSETLQKLSSSPLDIRAPQQVVSLVIANSLSVNASIRNPQSAFLGYSLTVHNLSDWAGGMRRFAREDGQVSRAEFKLLEALEIFKLELPRNGVALDLGASPGGWTRVLRQHGQYVTAIDPGDLDPRIASDKNVRHQRTTAEEYLRHDPDQFDVIVNDMRMDARDSARLMVVYARQLYPNGIAIMTLKLPEQKRKPAIEHALAILQKGYIILGVRQLFHNRSEITVVMRRK
ncbi:MAG: SAM-dependent methyltransferase [Caldilineaceae bacterium]